MTLPRPVAERLDRLAPDQRAAATAPPGPILCVAPAGSGKTTTLVARIAWLVASGVPANEITAVTFNRRAAVELEERLAAALDWLTAPSAAHESGGTRPSGSVRVRTFHALGLEILRSGSEVVPEIVDRAAILRALLPGADRATLARVDTAISRLKLDLDVDPAEVAADPEAGPLARAFVAYEATLDHLGSMDLDDLVRRSLRALLEDPPRLAHWRTRCRHLLVDEIQDVDRSQLRLALLLAAPANRLFLVGDDDQSIYGWRLADVRRVLALADVLPDLRRIDLEVNYRCPAPVLRRAVRLVEQNRERFAKRIRPGPAASGRLVLGPDASDDATRIDRLLDTWSGVEGCRAILARTNRELLPAAAIALARGVPFRAPGLVLPLEDPLLDELLERIRLTTEPSAPLLVRVGDLRRRLLAGEAAATRRLDQGGGHEDDRGRATPGGDAAAAQDAGDAASAADALLGDLLGWSPGFADLASLTAAVRAARAELARLRRDDAVLTLATAHATKGLEFDHVAVIGMDEGRFPSARALAEATDPDRALEEERRLAYVAWTRARRSLTLVFDPDAPSRFILEAFDPGELGIPAP